MKRLVGILAALLILCTARPAAGAAEPTEQTDVKALVEGNNAFAFDLYGKLKELESSVSSTDIFGKPKKQESNLFFSPFSISTALAMTYAGARGNTAAQMEKALHFNLGQQRLHPAFHGLIWDIQGRQKTGNYQLSVANALWGQKGYGFLPDFLKLTKDKYGAGLSEVDFEHDTEGARLAINKWVEVQTNNRIKDLVPPGVLSDLTRLVLTNAIYFKATWASEFKHDATRSETFMPPDGDSVQAPMMHQTHMFAYGETDELQTLEMLYKGNDLSMVVLLPRKRDGLAALEKALTQERLAELLDGLAQNLVELTLPKFKSTTTFRLEEVLKSLGVIDAFVLRKADFSGMSSKRDLFIQAVLHKAFVEVDEKGTEAAAATAVAMAMEFVPVVEPPRPKVFCADHPFLFLIRDRRTGSILFMGRVMNPKE